MSHSVFVANDFFSKITMNANGGGLIFKFLNIAAKIRLPFLAARHRRLLTAEAQRRRRI